SADHRRWPVLRHDGVLALRVPSRVRERAIRVRCRSVADPDRHRRDCGARHVAVDGYAQIAATSKDRGPLMRVDTLETPIAAPTGYDWHSLARRSRWQRLGGQSALLAFLLIV